MPSPAGYRTPFWEPFEAEVHRTYISEDRAGEAQPHRHPTATMIKKLAKPLGVAPGRLLD